VAGVLLAVAILLPLMPQLYSFDAPRWGGMPFFYWYQLVWVPISAALSGTAYWLVTSEDRRRRAAVRGGRPAPDGGPASSPGPGGPSGTGRHTASSDPEVRRRGDGTGEGTGEGLGGDAR
jgi:hypothetical protein